MKTDVDISGFPGVGKTAATLEIVKKLGKQYNKKMDTGLINCLSLSKPEHVYKNIWLIISKYHD